MQEGRCQCVSWLNLHLWCSRDVRKLIYSRLSVFDRYMVEVAHGVGGIINGFIQNAVLNRYVSLAEWARQHGYRLEPNLWNYAAANGHMHMLQWLHDKECPWDGCAPLHAAHHGHLCALQWMSQLGYPLHFATMSNAGTVEIVHWLREIGVPWQSDLCENAARNGRLSVLKCARENGCPWNVFTFARAAMRGDMAMLQWLLDNGCPWNHIVYTYAANEKIQKWLSDNGCPRRT